MAIPSFDTQDNIETKWDWTRLPAQQEFLLCDSRFQLFIGGFACGKTSVLCAKILLLMMGIPKNVGYLGRYDGKALRMSTLQSLLEMLPTEYIAKHNQQEGVLVLSPQIGGSKLFYGDFKDLRDFKNIPLGFFAMDQAEEVPREVWNYLVGRLRRRNPILTKEGQRQYHVHGACTNGSFHSAVKGSTHCLMCQATLPPFNECVPVGASTPLWDMICYKTYGLAVCNPEGPSHWIHDIFPGSAGSTPVIHSPDGRFTSVRATIYDGLRAGFVSRDYVDDLEKQYAGNELMRRRYLLGESVEAEGSVFPMWNRSVHVLADDSTKPDGLPLIPSDSSMYEYIDPAFTSPTAVGWVAVVQCDCGCESNNYFLFDEFYESHRVPSYISSIVHGKRASHPFHFQATYMDSQAFSKTLVGQKGTPREDQIYSVADEYADHGLWAVPNQKDWKAGHARLCELLTPDPRHTHPVTGEKNNPHFYVFSNCRWFIWEIEAYRWKSIRGQQNFTDEPADGHDHHMDGITGFLASRPAPATPPPMIDTKTILNELDELDISTPHSYMAA